MAQEFEFPNIDPIEAAQIAAKAAQEAEAAKAIEILAKYGDKATVIGKVTDKPGVVINMK